MRLAFVNMTSALPCRPDPRAVFDHVASDEQFRPWRHVIDPARAAAAAAAAIGGQAAEATEEFICLFFIAMLEHALEPLTGQRPCIGDITYPVVAKEHAEAAEALATARFAPTPANIARAINETKESVGAATLHLSVLGRKVGSTQRHFA